MDTANSDSAKIVVPVILGPTGVGKSDIALCVAEEFGYEILSCDSRQIYRGMDVGTAKPSADIRRRVAHHLIDILDPSQKYSAFAFARDAAGVIKKSYENGKKILICGGTGLYYQILAQESGGEFDFCVFLAERPRDELYDRINKRVDAMIEEGLETEFQTLVNAGYTKTCPGMITLGYRELFRAKDGDITFARAVELIKQNTRRYAKRQLTWFRNKTQYEKSIIDAGRGSAAIREILSA